MTQTAVTSRPLTVEPTTSKTIADPTSWREAAVLVLVRSGQPLRAAQIVTHATQWGLAPSSGTRTPAQSINRDLHAAMRNGDQRVEVGPRPGQFLAVTDPQRHVAGGLPVAHRPARGPRLPMEALQAAVDARGGLGACGLGGKAPNSESGTTHAKESQRLARAYHRSVARGWIDLYDADAIAIRHLGLHPCLLWGPGWWDTLLEADRTDGITSD